VTRSRDARLNLSAYYDSGDRDFICSQPHDHGMTKCSELPAYTDPITGRPCNGSVFDHSSTDDDCVNWNQFYSTCRAVGHNPFRGAISFDNIGLAWVAIFQVYSSHFRWCAPRASKTGQCFVITAADVDHFFKNSLTRIILIMFIIHKATGIQIQRASFWNFLKDNITKMSRYYQRLTCN